MYSDLIAVTFERRSEARTVLDALAAMRLGDLLGADSAAVVTCDVQGEEIRFHRTMESPIGSKSVEQETLGRLIDLILGEPLDRVEEVLGGTAFDVEFFQQVLENMQVHNSALFILVRPESVSDADQVYKALSNFRGWILQTTLTPEAEAAILEIE